MIENNKNINESDLIIPVYINEKIVLDMLAIVEDGFSLVSKINYTEDNANSAKGEIAANMSTDSILGKFLKIDFSPKASGEIDQNTTNNVQTEKVHTNVSLLSKFRKYLIEHDLLKTGLKFEELSIGDFIEINGELQKNPSLEYFDRVVDVLELVNAIMPSAELGNKNNRNYSAATTGMTL